MSKQKNLTEETPWEEVPSGVKDWSHRRNQEYLRRMGEKVPNDFILDLSDKAIETVLNWLKENNAPADVVSLLDEGHLLKNELIWKLENPQETNWENIPDAIIDTVQAIYKLNGTFSPNFL
jgi:hypothetical protein